MHRQGFRRWMHTVSEVVGSTLRCGVVAAGLLASTMAIAQEESTEAVTDGKYDQLPVPAAFDERGKDKDERAAVRNRVRDLKILVGNIVKGEQPLQANLAQFDGYYAQYLIPRMTWSETIEAPQQYNSLYKMRLALMNDLRAASQPIHDHLVTISLERLKEIASGNFHPASRINAMLLIAELNQKERVTTGTTIPPDPYLPALPFMVDTFASPDQLDGVKVAAMLGILRHIQWDTRNRETRQQQGGQPGQNRVDDSLRDRINQLSLDLLNADLPPEGRTVDGHAWMRRRAIDILGALGTIGTNVNAASTIERMVADEKVPISLRCSAAEALGQINLPPETRLNATETAGKLGELAMTACRSELKRIEDEKKWLADVLQSAGGASMPGMGGMGGMMGGMGGMMGGMPGGAAPPTADGAPSAAGMPSGMAMGGRGGSGSPMAARESAKKNVDAYKLEVAQRRLKSQLHSVKIGLAGIGNRTKGIQGLTKDGTKEREAIAELAKVIVTMRDMTDGDDIKDLDKLVSEVRKQIASLERATNATVALAKPAPPAKAKVNAAEPDEPDAPESKPAAGAE